MAWKRQTRERAGLTRRAEVANDFLRYTNYEGKESYLPLVPVASGYKAAGVGDRAVRRGLRDPDR